MLPRSHNIEKDQDMTLVENKTKTREVEVEVEEDESMKPKLASLAGITGSTG